MVPREPTHTFGASELLPAPLLQVLLLRAASLRLPTSLVAALGALRRWLRRLAPECVMHFWRVARKVTGDRLWTP